ncbi:MAG: MFS transporter [Solirubrobacteraceae bacterium]
MIATQFHVAKSTVTLSVTSSLIGYIIGAFADATIADKWGRRLSLGLSVGVFSLGTVLAAVSTNVPELIIFRFIAGLGIGAEIASVPTYIGELSPAPLRGRYTSWATTAAYAGFVVVPFIARGLVPTFASGWRILFLIGALGGVTILFMRRNLPPSPRWLMTQGRVEEAEVVVAGAEQSARETMGEALPHPESVPDEARAVRVPFRALLAPTMIRRVGLFVAIWFVYYIGNYGWLTLAPTLFTDKGYSLADSTTYLIVSGIGFLIGAYATTRFSDRMERKFAAAAVAVVWAIFAAGDRRLGLADDHHRIRLYRLHDDRPARAGALHLHRRALLDQRPRHRRGADGRARAHRRRAGATHRARRQRGLGLLRRVRGHGHLRRRRGRADPARHPIDRSIPRDDGRRLVDRLEAGTRA